MTKQANRLGFFLTMALSGFLGACGSSDGEKGHKLFINELQPSNQDVIKDEHGEADDWIEIFNPGGTAVDLQGFRVADSSGTSQVIAGPLVVQPGGFVLLWADDSPSQGAAHLGFKLGAKKGDALILTDPDGQALDSVSFSKGEGQSSYARYPDGTGAFAWCTVPTPGTSNGAACAQ
jgi:hypothetical protein